MQRCPSRFQRYSLGDWIPGPAAREPVGFGLSRRDLMKVARYEVPGSKQKRRPSRRGLRWSVKFLVRSFSPEKCKGSHVGARQRGRAEGGRVGGFSSSGTRCGSICRLRRVPRRDGLCHGLFVVDSRQQPNRRSESIGQQTRGRIGGGISGKPSENEPIGICRFLQ